MWNKIFAKKNRNLAACRRGRVSLLQNRLTDFTARQIEIYR